MPVPAMATQGVALDAIRERVQRAVGRGRLGILSLGLCADLLRLRRRFERVACEVGDLDVRTDNERTLLCEFARGQQQVAETSKATETSCRPCSHRLSERFSAGCSRI